MEQLMKIDPATLKNLRDARAWSQEHLASVAGLSVRTVQRIEADGSASAESRLALAAALDVAPGDLCPPALTPAAPTAGEAAARSGTSKGRSAWTLHLALYLLAGSLLTVLKLTLSGSIGWAIYPLLGWGGGLLLHYWLRRRVTGRKTRLVVGLQ